MVPRPLDRVFAVPPTEADKVQRLPCGEQGITHDQLNRPGIVGGSNSEVGWSHHEQNDEQIFT